MQGVGTQNFGVSTAGWLKWVSAPPKAPGNFRNRRYSRESLAGLSALARQPFPGSTGGSLGAHVTRQGAEVGLVAVPDVPAARAGPVCPAVLEGPAGGKTQGGGRGHLGGPFGGLTLPREIQGTRGGSMAPTPLARAQVGRLRAVGEWLPTVSRCLGSGTKDPLFPIEVGAGSALRGPGGG